MARQLRALGRALCAVSVSAPAFAVRAGAPLGLGSMRAFSAAGVDPPVDGTSATRHTDGAALTRISPGTAAPEQASLRETVERRLTGASTLHRAAPRRRDHPSDEPPRDPHPADASLQQSAPGEELPAEPVPARKRLTVVKRSEQIAEASSDSGAAQQSGPPEPPRLHPLRLFYPGQTYKPEELDGEAPDALAYVHLPSQKTRQLYKRGKVANAELYATADFRNGRLLNSFVSEAGKLLPRRTNKVDAKVQRKIVRAVKTARMMAILPYTDRLPAFTRGRKNPYS